MRRRSAARLTQRSRPSSTFNPGPLSRESLEILKDRLSKEGLDFTLKPDGEIVIGNFDDNADFDSII